MTLALLYKQNNFSVPFSSDNVVFEKLNKDKSQKN